MAESGGGDHIGFTSHSSDETNDSFVVLDESTLTKPSRIDEAGQGRPQQRQPGVPTGASDYESNVELTTEHLDAHNRTHDEPTYALPAEVLRARHPGKDASRSSLGQEVGTLDDAVLDMALPPDVMQKVQFLANENDRLKETLIRTNLLLRDKLKEMKLLQRKDETNNPERDQRVQELQTELQTFRTELGRIRQVQSAVQEELEAERSKNQELSRRLTAFKHLQTGGTPTVLDESAEVTELKDALHRTKGELSRAHSQIHSLETALRQSREMYSAQRIAAYGTPSSEVDGILTKERYTPYGPEASVISRQRGQLGDETTMISSGTGEADSSLLPTEGKDPWEMVNASIGPAAVVATTGAGEEPQTDQKQGSPAATFLERRGVKSGGQQHSGSSPQTEAPIVKASSIPTQASTDEQEVAKLSKALAQREDVIADLKDQVEVLRSDFDNRIGPYLTERRQLTAKVMEAKNVLDATKQQLATIEGKNAKLTENYAKCLAQIESFKKARESQDEEIRQTKLALEKAEMHVHRLRDSKEDLSQLQQQLGEMQELLSVKTQQLEFMYGENNEVKDKLSKLRALGDVQSVSPEDQVNPVELDKLKKDLQARNKTMKQLYTDLKATRAQLDRIDVERKQRRASEKKKDEDMESLRHNSQRLTSEVGRMRDKAEAAQHEAFSAKHELSALKLKRDELEDALKHKQEEVEDLQLDLQREKDRSLPGDPTMPSADLGEGARILQQRVKQRDESIRAMEKEMQSIKEKCDRLEEEKVRTMTESQVQESEAQRLKERLSVAEQDARTLASEKAELEDLLADAQSECERKRSEKADLDEELHVARRLSTALSSQKAVVEARLAKVEEEQEELRCQKETLEARGFEQVAVNEVMQEEMKKTKKDMEVSQRHLKHLRGQLEKADEVEESLKVEADENRLRVATLEKECHMLESRLEKTKVVFKELNDHRVEVDNKYLAIAQREESNLQAIQDLTGALATLQGDLQTEKANSEAAKQAKVDILREKSRLLEEHGKVKEDYQRARQQLLDTEKGFKDRERELNTMVMRQQNEVAEYRNAVSRFSAEQREHYEQIRSLRQQLETNARLVTQLRRENEELEKRYEQATKRLDNNLQHLKRTSDEKRTDEVSHQRQVSQLVAENAALDEESKMIKEKLKAMTGHRDSLSEELDASKAEMAGYRSDFEEEHNSRERLKIENLRLARERDNFSDEVDKIKKENSRLKANLDETQANQQIAAMRRRAIGDQDPGRHGDQSSMDQYSPPPPEPALLTAASRNDLNRGAPQQQHQLHQKQHQPPLQHQQQRQPPQQQQQQQQQRQHGGGVMGYAVGGHVPEMGQPAPHPTQPPADVFHMNIPPAGAQDRTSVDYTCPACGQEYPDLTSLQVHVHHCIT